jgi:hypothetical protein
MSKDAVQQQLPQPLENPQDSSLAFSRRGHTEKHAVLLHQNDNMHSEYTDTTRMSNRQPEAPQAPFTVKP